MSCIVTVSIVATANNIRYGSAKIEPELGGTGGGIGVGGFEIETDTEVAGLGARIDNESLVESTGEGNAKAEGGCANTGAGIASGASSVGLEGD